MQPQGINLTAKYSSAPNIAWVKYWGKYDEDYILPINDSLGLSLNHKDIATITTISFSKANINHSLILNSENHPITKRMNKMFDRIMEIAYQRKYSQEMSMEELMGHHFKIVSQNSFPTASGMASSASGLSCLAAAINGLFGEILSDDELSELARLGSGSASRSIWGGLVHWKGVPIQILNSSEKTTEVLEKLSKQCISHKVVEQKDLSDIKVMILLANNKKKQVSSTSGMQTSVKTSQLIQYRNKIADKRCKIILEELEKYRSDKNPEQQRIKAFNLIMETIIKDSNQFHAICLDTYPPIFYLNEFSQQIIHIIDHFINPCLQYKIAYTFDAGPHAFLFMHQKAINDVLSYFIGLFGLKGHKQKFNEKAWKLSGEMVGDCSVEFKEYKGQIVSPYQIWVTDVGYGALNAQ